MRTGDRIAERFVVVAPAARGGMSELYRGRDEQTGDAVAIKVITSLSHGATERFQRESQMLRDLDHPAIVRYVAHGESAAGAPFLVMEWLDGEDLSQRLRRQPLTPAESLSVAKRIAEGLAAAARHGIVHRDIKPGNIFLVGRDLARVKLLDFGVARAGYFTSELTGTGFAVGTPSYMSPEQARGSRGIDSRADIYSLGCVLFRCLTGRTPFEGPDPIAVLARIALEEPPRLRSVRDDLPPELDELLGRMLARDPADRPPTAEALLEQLRRIAPATITSSDTPAARLSAVGDAERRLVAIVFVKDANIGAAADASVSAPEPSSDVTHVGDFEEEPTALGRAPTGVTGPTITPTAKRLSNIAQRQGAEVVQLADGSCVLVLRGDRAARDLATRAARTALALRELFGTSPMGVALGLSDAEGAEPLRDAIERATPLVRRRTPPRRDDQRFVPIWLDEPTARLLDRAFVVEEVGDAALLFVENVDDGSTRLRVRQELPFVGRDREMQTLEATLAECRDGSVSRVVLVKGAAGSGKTRLAQEFARRVTQGDATATVVELSAPASGPATAYAALAAALRAHLGLGPRDSADARALRVRAAVDAVIAEADRERVSAFLAEAAGASDVALRSPLVRAARSDAVVLGDQTRRALREYLVARAAAGAMVFVLDDLQWLDAPSVRFAESLTRSARRSAILVAAFARSDTGALNLELQSGPGRVGIELGPIARRHAEQLLGAALPETTPERLREILERSDGNPFVLEELVRAEKRGRGGELPPTVMAMLNARLDHVDAPARRVLRAGSVFGQSFPLQGVIALLGGSDASEVREWIELIEQRDLVVESTPPRFADSREYRFVHRPVRDAVYATLTDDDRRAAHCGAGAWLAAHGERDAMVLAEHFETGGDTAAALPWILAAANDAMRGNDLAGAAALALRGASLAGASMHQTASVRALATSLMLLRADALRWRGENAAALEAAAEARAMSAGGSKEWFTALAVEAMTSGRLGLRDRVLEFAGLLAGIDVDARTSHEAIEAACRISVFLTHLGEHAEAARMLDLAERVLRNGVAVEPRFRATVGIARFSRALVTDGPGAALAWVEQAVAAADEAADIRTGIMQRVNLAFTLGQLGAFERAREILDHVLRLADDLDIGDVRAARGNLGEVLRRLGESAQAIRLLSEAVNFNREHENLRREGVARIFLGRALRTAGRLDDAEQELLAATELLGSVPDYLAVAHAALASLLRSQVRVRDAGIHARRAKELRDQCHYMESGETLVAVEYAYALHASGEFDAAHRAIGHARDRLLAQAAHVADPILRNSFLARVEDNFEALDLAAEWLGPG